MTGREGYITLLLKSNRFIKNDYFVKDMMKKDYDNLVNCIRDIKILEN